LSEKIIKTSEFGKLLLPDLALIYFLIWRFYFLSVLRPPFFLIQFKHGSVFDIIAEVIHEARILGGRKIYGKQ